MPQKNTPRDFFLHLGAFASLYLAAIALLTLLFRVIDYALPDILRDTYYYSDPYSGPIRFAIASLIILVPLFIFLMNIIQNEARISPERRTLTIRRWLTYITLFVAGVTIIGDFIALLYSFLGGELASSFLLKTLVLLLVMGLAFWYFMLDIRGYWQDKRSASRMVGAGVGILALAAIVAGFIILGSPMMQRDLRFDAERVNHLSSIQYQITDYWQRNETLPQDIETLTSPITGFEVPLDPRTQQQYEYRVTGPLSFELCATFDAETPGQLKGDYTPSHYPDPIRNGTDWQHGEGRECFEREIDPALLTPFTR